MEDIQNLDFDLVGDQFQSVGHVAGRRVVTIAKSGRQDQDFFHAPKLARSCDSFMAIMLNSVHIFRLTMLAALSADALPRDAATVNDRANDGPLDETPFGCSNFLKVRR